MTEDELPEHVTLEFVARQSLRILAGQNEINGRLAAIEAKLEQHSDENRVLTGMVLHYAGERMAWAGMEVQIRKIHERLAALEGKK